MNIKKTNSEYITLQQAASLCPHSQEYLSLRARQGKLNAVKIGRNWSTTKDWLVEYLDSAEEYKNGVEIKRNGKTSTQPQKPLVTRLPSIPPANLPVWDVEFVKAKAQGLLDEHIRIANLHRRLGLVFSGVVLILSISLSVVTWRTELADLGEKVNPVVAATLQDFSVGFEFALRITLFETGQFDEKLKVGFASMADAIPNQYVSWIQDKISLFGRTVANAYKNVNSAFTHMFENLRSRFAQKPPPSEYEDKSDMQVTDDVERQDPIQGLVVVPSTAEDERVKEQIKQSFSDEVIVSMHDDESGIITPIFREREGDDFLYILIPLQDVQ